MGRGGYGDGDDGRGAGAADGCGGGACCDHGDDLHSHGRHGDHNAYDDDAGTGDHGGRPTTIIMVMVSVLMLIAGLVTMMLQAVLKTSAGPQE
eukprot:1484176-Alexandrium_andersonii.AAC.1